MKNFIYIALSFLLMTGCKPGVPKDLIQPDKMALVLHDIHIFDGYVNTISNIDTPKAVAASYYLGIYKKFAVDSALFARSMSYYNAHPKVMNEIYDEVVKRLDKERKAFMKADSLANIKILKQQKAKMKADSLKMKKDSLKIKANAVKQSEAAKIDLERKKLVRQLDSLKNLRLSPKDRLKSDALKKKLADSLKSVKKKDSLRKAKQSKKRTKVSSVKKLIQ
jgi:hypothetical protein